MGWNLFSYFHSERVLSFPQVFGLTSTSVNAPLCRASSWQQNSQTKGQAHFSLSTYSLRFLTRGACTGLRESTETPAIVQKFYVCLPAWGGGLDFPSYDRAGL